MEFKQITYFGSLPKNAFIYEKFFNENSVCLYKYKVLKKTIVTARLNGKFGGPKITKVILELQLVEYQNRPYFTEHTFKVELDARYYIASYQGNAYYSDFERFKDALYYEKCTLENSIELIEECLKK